MSAADNSIRASLLETGMPLLFVLIWSTGFIVAKFGLPYAPPLLGGGARYGSFQCSKSLPGAWGWMRKKPVPALP